MRSGPDHSRNATSLRPTVLAAREATCRWHVTRAYYSATNASKIKQTPGLKLSRRPGLWLTVPLPTRSYSQIAWVSVHLHRKRVLMAAIGYRHSAFFRTRIPVPPFNLLLNFAGYAAIEVRPLLQRDTLVKTAQDGSRGSSKAVFQRTGL